MELNRKDFFLLHQAVLNQYQFECERAGKPVPDTAKEKYWFEASEGKGYTNSLKYHLLENKAVLDYFKEAGKDANLNGKYLYLRWSEYKSGSETIHFQGVHDDIYFLYLGINETEVEEKLAKLNEKYSLPGTICDYQVSFYDFRSHSVKGFEMTINYSNPDGIWHVEAREWHNRYGVPSVYQGKAEKKRGCLWIHLKDATGKSEELNIVTYVGGGESPENLNIQVGALSGISSDGCPLGVEVVLRKNTGAEKVLDNETEDYGQAVTEEEEKTAIQRYLMLKRNNFRVRNKVLENVKKLVARGHRMEEVAHMVGSWKVLNFDGRGNLILSKYILEENYSSYFFTTAYNADNNYQICLPGISKIINQRLCLSCHPREVVDAISFVIVNIPSEGDRGAEMVTEGVFSAIGRGDGSVCGRIIMVRDNSDFKPCILNNEKEEVQVIADSLKDEVVRNRFWAGFDELLRFLRRDERPEKYQDWIFPH